MSEIAKKEVQKSVFCYNNIAKETKKKNSKKKKLHNKKEITSFAFRLCSMQICIVR